MAKGYWINFFRSAADPDKLAAYAQLARPAIEHFGGRFLARGEPARTFEAGLVQRVALVEFDSVEDAIAAYESPAYQAALEALGDDSERDLRIVEGVS